MRGSQQLWSAHAIGMPVPSPWREALRWLARILAIGLFVFWGAFFVAHLQEWFFHESGAQPPVKVWIGQFLHLLMLVGLGSLLWRPALGAWLTIATTTAFFAWIGFSGDLYLPLLNAIPALMGLGGRKPNSRNPSTEPDSTAH